MNRSGNTMNSLPSFSLLKYNDNYYREFKPSKGIHNIQSQLQGILFIRAQYNQQILHVYENRSVNKLLLFFFFLFSFLSHEVITNMHYIYTILYCKSHRTSTMKLIESRKRMTACRSSSGKIFQFASLFDFSPFLICHLINAASVVFVQAPQGRGCHIFEPQRAHGLRGCP